MLRRKHAVLFNKPLIVKKISDARPQNIVKHIWGGDYHLYVMLNIGRSYSTLSSSAIVPEKIYMNADLDKAL